MPLLTPHVPGGLIDLMKNLAKEVLRDKPENIYEFAAVHFEKLIQQRDGSLDKDYEQFVAFQTHFDGQQRFAVPSNSGYICQRPIKIQPILHTKKSKSDMLAGFKAMESINEEDVLTETPYSNEKYQKAIYIIQRFYRRYMAQRKNQSSTTLTAATAAIIIQRTMRRLFANKIKLKTNDEDTAKHDGVVQDDEDVDNVSEAASYTSSSTIQMLADSQEGRENRLPGREVALSDVSGAADDDGSTGFKEQTTVAQDAAPIIPPPSTTESSEADGKSIADENGNIGSTHPEETTPNHPTPAHDDDTSTAHIGKLSTIIGSNDQQNSLHTYTVEIDSNSSDATQIITPVVAVGKTPPSLGASPSTLPSTSPRPAREEHFAVHLQGSAYAENSAANPYQSVAHIRKFDPNTGESLKAYDVFSQDRDDPDFSDSLNESTMERDSLENEDLDVDSLESNESVTHASGGIAKREVAHDYGKLYGNTNEVPEQEKQDVHQSVQLERVPTYLYGIHPSRTPIAERKNKRSRNPSAESTKVSDTKDLATAVSLGIGDRTPEERSEEESLESKGSTSEESSATQIEIVSDVAHKTDRKAAGGDDLKSYEGASIKIDAVDGVPASSLQKETSSAGNTLAINSGEEANAQTDDVLRHGRDFSMENSLDDTKTPVDAPKRDGATASVSQEVNQTDSERFSQETGSEKQEIRKSDNDILQLAVDKGLSKEITLENEEALSSKKPQSGLVESTNKLADGLAKSKSLVAEAGDLDRLQKPSVFALPKDSSKPPAAIEDASQIDSEASRDGRLKEVSLPAISDRASDKVSNTNTENLPEEEGLTVEAKGSFETQKMLVSDGGLIENGTKDGSKVNHTTILEKTETADDQAKTTTRHKRSLHDTDLVHADRSDQELSLALEPVTKSADYLTGNMEASSKSVGSATYHNLNNKHDLKIDKQVEASSSNSQLGYFANLYSAQSSGGTMSSILENHDQQVESQLRELKSLTDLYPGLEIKDVMSEFHTRDIQPDARVIDEDIVHDRSNSHKLGKFEESPKDKKPSGEREPSIEDSRSVSEKAEGKDEDGLMGKPKGLHESSKEIEGILTNNSKIRTTLKEPKMEKDEVSNRDDEDGISRAIKIESVSGLNKAVYEGSLEHNDKSQKMSQGLLKLAGDRIGEDSNSDTDATVDDNLKRNISPTDQKDDKIKNSGANTAKPEIKSENSKQTKDENLNTLTPVTSSSKLAPKSVESIKSDEVKTPSTARAEPKLQEEDYFGNTIDRNIQANDNPVFEILKADGVTLKAAGSTLPKVEEEPHGYVRDSVQIFDSVSEKPTDNLLREDKRNLTDVKTDANLRVSLGSESWLEPEKEILSAEVSSSSANEGTSLPKGRKEQGGTDEEHKSYDSHYTVPKIKGESNSENASDSMAVKGDGLSMKEKTLVDKELMSRKMPNGDDTSALINSEKHPSTGMQPLADLEMSKLLKSDVKYVQNRTRSPDKLKNDEANIKEGKPSNDAASEASMAVKKDKYRIQNKLTSDKMFEPDAILALNKSEKHPSTDIELRADSEMIKHLESDVEYLEDNTELSNVPKGYKDNIQEGENENDTEGRSKIADSHHTGKEYHDENKSTSSKIPQRDDGLVLTKAENHASTDIEPAPGVEMSNLSKRDVKYLEDATGSSNVIKSSKDNIKEEKSENGTEAKNKMADRADDLNTEVKYRHKSESTSGKTPKRAESLALTKAENNASTDIEPAPGVEMSNLSKRDVKYLEDTTGSSNVPKGYKDNIQEVKSENDTEGRSKIADSHHTEKEYHDENKSTSSKIPQRDDGLVLTKAENHASTDIEPAPGVEMSNLSKRDVKYLEDATGSSNVIKSSKDNIKEEKSENGTEAKNKMADRADDLNTEVKYRHKSESTSGKTPKRAESLALTKAENNASTDIEPAPGVEMSNLSKRDVKYLEDTTGSSNVPKGYKDNIQEVKSENDTEGRSKIADSHHTEKEYHDENKSTSSKIPQRDDGLVLTKAENHASTDIEPAPGVEMSNLSKRDVKYLEDATGSSNVIKSSKDNIKEEKSENGTEAKNKMADRADDLNTEVKYRDKSESTSGKTPKRAESLALTKAENNASTDIEPAPGVEMSNLSKRDVKYLEDTTGSSNVPKGYKDNIQEVKSENDTEGRSKIADSHHTEKEYHDENKSTSSKIPQRDDGLVLTKAENHASTDIEPAPGVEMSNLSKRDVKYLEDATGSSNVIKSSKDNIKEEKSENGTEAKNKMADRADDLNTEVKYRHKSESTSGKTPKRAESLALTKAENNASTDIEPAPGVEMSNLSKRDVKYLEDTTGSSNVPKGYKDNIQEVKSENDTEGRSKIADSHHTEKEYHDENKSTSSKIPQRDDGLVLTKAENHASTDIEPAPGVEMSNLSKRDVKYLEDATGSSNVIKSSKDNIKEEKSENGTEAKNKMADRTDSLNTEEKYRDKNELTSGKSPKRAESLALTKAENNASTDIKPALGVEMSNLSKRDVKYVKEIPGSPNVLKSSKDNIQEEKIENGTEAKNKMADRTDSLNTEEKYRDKNELTSGKSPKRAESLALTKAESNASKDIKPAPGVEMSNLSKRDVKYLKEIPGSPNVLKSSKDNIQEEKSENGTEAKNKMADRTDSLNTEEKYRDKNELTSGKSPKRAESLALTKAENNASTDIEPALTKSGVEHLEHSTRLHDDLKSDEDNVKRHKSNETQGPISKRNEGENRENCADDNDKAIATNDTLQKSKAISIAETDKKHIVDNKLTSTTVKNDNHSARSKAEQLSMTDTQTAAISGMPEMESPQDISSTKVKNVSAAKSPGLTGDLQPKSKDSISKRGENGTEKTGNNSENPDKMKGPSFLTIGNDRLVENLPTAGKFVKGDNSYVKQTSHELEIIEKPFSIQTTVTDDDSSENVNLENSSTKYESEFPPQKKDSAELKSISESSKQLKSIAIGSENNTPLPITPNVEKNFRVPMESLENSIPSLQNLRSKSESKVLERSSKSASLEDKTLLEKKDDLGVLDSEISLQVDNNIQSKETLVGTVSNDYLVKDIPGLEFKEKNVYPDKTDEDLKGERSTLALNIPKSSAGKLGLTVSGTNEKPGQVNAERLHDSSEVAEVVLMKEKLGLEHVSTDVDASRNRSARSENTFEVKIPDPSFANIKPDLGKKTLDDSSSKSKIALGARIGEGEKSGTAEPVLKTNSEGEIPVTKLPKLDVEHKITEDQIEAVNEAIGKPEPVKSIEGSEPSQVGIKKQIDDLKESKDKRLETAPNDYVPTKQADGSSIEQLNSVTSSVSLPTEVTSSDDSNAETSADFSSIGKDLDFFEDTINYLKSATTQLTTMDDIFTEDGGKLQSGKGLVDHVADADSEIRPKPEDDLHKVKEDAFNQTENHSPVVEGQETAKSDGFDQAATTIQSAVRGYRVRRELNRKQSGTLSIGDQQSNGNITKPTKDSCEFEKNLIRNHSPIAVAEPLFIIHPVKDVSSKEPASKDESKSDKKTKETECKALEQSPEQIDSQTKTPSKPDFIASHRVPPGIACEKPIQRAEKSAKTDATISLQQIENPIENKSSIETQKVKSFITREKPIERKSKPIKSDSLDETKTSVKSYSFDRGQLESSSGRPKIPVPEKQKTAAKPLKTKSDKPKTKILRSKVPSTSNLMERDRSAQSKRTQLGRNVRSVSVKEQNQQVTVFDLEAIKNDLLSTKKVRSSKNYSGRHKMPQRKSNDPIQLSKVSDSAKKSTSSIVKSEKAQGSVESKEQQISDRQSSEKNVVNDPKLAAVKSDPKIIFDALQSVTNTVPSVESLKENSHSSQQISATTIQKNFRGYRTRKNLKSVSETEKCKNPEMTVVTEDKLNIVNAENGSDHMQKQSDEDNSKNSKVNGNSGIFDTLKRDVEDFKNIALDKSATKIQKTFRGFRTRKSLKADNESPRRTIKKLERIVTPKESDVLNKAVKNRSNFVKTQLSEEKFDQKEKGQDNFFKLNDSFEDANNEALNKSAITIQRNFRGYKTRKNLKKAKSFESISNQTFIIKSKSKEVGDALNDEDTTCITSTEENPSNMQRVSPKIVENPNKEKESGSSAIFQNLKRDMDSFKNATLDKSAVQIQKTFRGYKTRKGLKNDVTETDKSPHTTNQTSDQTLAVEPKVLKTENEDHKGSRKTNTKMSGKIKRDVQVNSLDESAITIQKTFRGYKTRKVLKDDLRKINNQQGAKEISDEIVTKESSNILYADGKPLTKESESKRKAKDNNFQAGIFDNSQSDAEESPALNEFATTIQKTFRGYKTRKEMMAKGVNLKGTNTDANLVQLSKVTKSDEMLTSSHPQSGDVGKSESERVRQKLSKNASNSHGMKKSKSAEEIAFTDVSEKAAITIQKTYKGFKARKELKTISKLNKDIEAKPPLSKNDINSQITSNSENAKSLSENATITTKVDTESSTNSESEYLNLMHRDEIAFDDPAKSFSTTRAASAGALLGAAASTIQKAFRDYHSRKESTLHKTKSYSHGAQRDNAPKETIDTSDESSTFIGPDTSFDLSDIDSVGTKSTPTLELEISNPPSFALSTQSEVHDIENDCANAAPVSENSLSVSPQRILRKRSIMDATAPLLVDILNAGESTDSNEKPQWYVGEDLIVPSTDMGPSTFQNPLASSSSFDKSSSIDSRNDSFISNLQPTPSINSAVVSTSSLLCDTKDTEMHDTIRNTPKHLNKHSRAVSADEEEMRTEKETEVKNEVNNCQKADKADEKTEKQNVDEEDVYEENGASTHGLTDLAESSMLTSTDPFSPRNGIDDVKDAPQSIVTELCKNCADGVHEVHEDDITMASSGGKLPEAELSDKTENRAVNPGDTKDITQSTNKHFDDIKQFVLMEDELKTTEWSSENKESKKANETNGNDTETSAMENVQEQGGNPMSNATSVDDQSELPLVAVDEENPNADDTNVGPSIALIPPSSEEETSDRESTHEFEKISQSEKNIKSEENNATAAEKDKSPSEGASSNESEKNYIEKQQSVDNCQGIVPATGDEVKEIDIVGACEKVSVDSTDGPNKTKHSGCEGDLKDSIRKEPKIEVDSTESEKIQNGVTDKVDEDPPTKANSQNVINLEQKSEDILHESTTVKSCESNLDGALNLPDFETDTNCTTKPTKGSQDDNEKRNQNLAIGPEEMKASLENGIDVKAETVDETKAESNTELNYTGDVENGITTQESRTENSEQSGEYVDKLNEDSSELKSNIVHPLDFAEKSEDKLKITTNKNQKFEDNFNESFTDKIAVEDPIKVIQESRLSSVVSEDKTAESTSHESLKTDEENATNPENVDSKVVKWKSSGDSAKEENEIPADVGLLQDSKLKRVESNKDGSSHETVDEGDISKSNSNVDDVNKGANDLEPKALIKEDEVQNKSEDVIPSEERTASDSEKSNIVSILEGHKQPSKEPESLLTDGIHKTSSKDANLKAVEKKDPEVKSEDQRVDLDKSIDHSEDPGKVDSNATSTNEGAAPITEHMVTDSREVMAISGKLKDPPIASAEDLEIASKLLEGCLCKTDLSHSVGSDKQPSVDGESANVTTDVKPSPENVESKQNSPDQLSLSDDSLTIQANLEKLIDESVRQVENDVNPINPQDLPVENSPNEVVEKPCVKKVLPPTPLSATSDQDESELESTTTKAESTTTSPAYDGASDNDALEIPPSLPDSLEAIAEKLRETEKMVARMHQRRASEHKISIDIADQPPAFDDRISEPIRPMRELQKSSSTDVEDDIILQKLQRGNTTRESSAQSESVVFGDSTSQLTESEDAFTESLDVKALHRMHTIAVDGNSYKPSNLLQKSVTIDDTVKYIDPEKSTEESGGSFCLDDAISADVRKKMMAYSISEADSDYYDVGERTARLHDDFNISTALDTSPSSETDTTTVSAATKIQAGARGFLTRRRLRRASMGTKSSLNEETKTSFGNDAIGESLDRLVEEEDGKRKPKVQYQRQVGVNSLPSALGNSTETETPSREHIHAGDDSDGLNLAAKLTSVAEEIIALPHGEGSSIDGQRGNRNFSTASENDVNGGQETDDESAHVPPNLEATLAARRLTLQRGDAMRNDSTPDDDNGNAKQVDPAKSIPAAAAGTTSMLIHQITMVDSTTMATTPAETTTTTTMTTTTEKRNYSDAAMTIKMDKVKWFAMRQNSMPVQIDSEVFRVLPKHMRKRIKSAEGEQRKRIRLPRD